MIDKQNKMNQKEANVQEFNKFLQNNHDFLQEKYTQHFKKKSVPLKDFKNQSAIKFIYDVFSFSKYEADQKMNKTLKKSLNTNINDFLKIETDKLSKKQKLDFDLNLGILLLKYCIENNQMFAVKYDKKDKKMKTQNRDQEQANQQQPQQKQQEEVQKQQEPQNQQQQQKQEDEQIQNKQAQIQQKQQQQIPNNSQLTNQFQVTKQLDKAIDPNVMKKNLRQMFQFYCRQQQNSGVNATFDRINQQCHSMTLGKFLSFAISSGIKNDKIDKNIIMRKFKLSAEGRKQIDFQKFYELIQILASMDQSLIPKLGVDDKSAFRVKMKQKHHAFNTKDTTFRQLKKPHIFIPRLTGHSGKMSDALLDQLKNRKQARVATSLIKNSQKNKDYSYGTPNKGNRYNNLSRLESSQFLSPKQLAASKLRDFDEDVSFLEKMINAEEGDQEWLKDYKISKSKNHIDHSKGATTFLPSINSHKKMANLERSQTRQSIHTRKRQGFQYMGGIRQKSNLA